MGVVTALGFDTETFWNNMLAGKSGIHRVTAFDISEHKARNGSEVDNASMAAALSRSNVKATDRALDMAFLASAQALEQAGVISGKPPYQATDTAAIFGTGIGSSHSLYNAYRSFFEKGVKGLRPTTVPRCMANAISAQLSMRFKLLGPNYVIICACTSSTTAIGTAFRMIRHGYADRVLCGGADADFDPFVYGAWNNLGVMSKNPEPEKSCRPFDGDRDGCVLGEGAGALVLESMESACQRNATILGEVCGYGETSDATHITTPSAEGQARSITAALQSASMTPQDLGFVNAHGTATRANDECEAQSIRMALGDETDRIPVASNKSFFGHLLGACGAVETIVTVMGLDTRKVPPNLNLDNPDPACPLRLVGKEPMEIASPVAMKNSFGFGGNNAVLILRRWDE